MGGSATGRRVAPIGSQWRSTTTDLNLNPDFWTIAPGWATSYLEVEETRFANAQWSGFASAQQCGPATWCGVASARRRRPTNAQWRYLAGG